MQALFTLEFDNLRIPRHYNHIIQAVIFKMLEENYAKFLHDNGFRYGKRSYKLFTFSKLYGDFIEDRKTNELIYTKSARLYVACADDLFFEYFIQRAFSNNELKIHRQPVYITHASLILNDFSSNTKTIVKSVSPVTVYSTKVLNNEKKVYYYSPSEPEFFERLTQNLRRKYISFYGTEPQGEIRIEPVGTYKKAVVNYKGAYITAWNGLFKLSGSGTLIKFALDTGLGSKNSQGFGCVLVHKDCKNQIKANDE
ncbi:CRISPR-associated endoribonuclease Cas6 [Fervidobacterium thailandense]|uniref:CRISPR-associated endoribonuclease n=1 Tax=Fervidobacterium thailandense TaxID=1008305 RepID=A0A1E3G1B7_9BACT|nr:CRISPR-associated endoribonuclease Cas6 [Fervidobacterium thailandense]ODN29653.1 hypothetical protein A4H02_09600 [Fervidobacterium thailandense]